MAANPDYTILDLLIAGNFAAANEALENGHPDAFGNTVAAAALTGLTAKDATSGTSLQIGVGEKVLTLAAPRSWKAGMPIHIAEDGDPNNRFMQGYLSQDEATGGVLTVQVTSVKGSGTFTAWTLFALFATTTVASPPIAEADGGFAASDWETGRRNVELIRGMQVSGVTPSPAAGETWVGENGLDEILVSAGGFDEFASKDWQIATWVDDHWEFRHSGVDTPHRTTMVFDVRLREWWQLTGDGAGGHFGTLLSHRTVPTVYPTAAYAISHDPTRQKMIIFADTTGGGFTVTLPTAGADGDGLEYEIWNAGNPANVLTVNVNAGGTINGAASVDLLAQYARLKVTQKGVNDFYGVHTP